MKIARGLNFWNWEVEGLYYLRSKNKGVDQLRSNPQLSCAFVLAYEIGRFSNDSNEF